MRELLESGNYCELYNCYALWITDNRQFFTTGSSAVKKSDSQVKKPFGFRSYLKTFLTTEADIHSAEQHASEYLTDHPDEFIKNADIFARQFPNIIKNRQEKLKQKKTMTNTTLNEHFEQLSVELTPKSDETETERLLAMAQRHGAKMFKKGDLEIHF
jgi:hypothetical protein